MLCFRCGSYNVDDATTCSVCGQVLAAERGAKSTKKRTPKAQPGIFTAGEMVGGKYRVVDVIGQGGVGTVYRARDIEIDVDVALKAIAPNLLQADEEQKLFSKMMKAARKLHHPNIIRIYDEGAEGNRRYFTMKLLEGLTLRKIIRLRHDKGQAFTPEEIIPIFHQLGAALDYAHKSTWHGDLKPENVIILPDLLKVTDFNLLQGLPLKPFLGIAKSRSKGFPYIAPELRVESSNIDGRCDVYSLGVILAEMLTGLVYEGHFTRALTASLEQLPTKVDGLVRRALSEHPDGRWPKASEMARELESGLEKLAPGGLPAPQGKAPKKPRVKPPPPPAETNPGVVPPERTDEAPSVSSEEGASLEEIGQSQVVLLDETGGQLTESSEPSTIDAAGIAPLHRQERASAIMRAMTPPPVDGAEEEAGVDDEQPAEGAGKRPPLPEGGGIETLYNSRDQLVPPPLPENADLDASDSFDVPEGLSMRGAGGRDGSPASLKDDVEEEETAPDLEEVGIHEELTALKPHPRPGLVDPPADDERGEGAAAPPDDDDDEDPSALETVTRAEPSSPVGARGSDGPPPIPLTKKAPDDEEPPDVASAEELAHAKERSSPRLHAAEPVAPPVLAPQPSGGHVVPPGLRPVAPPTMKKSAAGLWIGMLAVVAAIAFAVVVLTRGDGRGGSSEHSPAPVVVDRAAVVEPQLVTAPEPLPPVVEPVAPPAPAEAVPDPVAVAPVVEPAVEKPVERTPAESTLEPQRDPKKAQSAAELARIEAQAREQKRKEEEERRRWEEEKRALDEQRRLAESELNARREAEKVAAEARKKAEEEEMRRRDEEAKKAAEKNGEKKLAAAAVVGGEKKCPAGMQLVPGGSFTMGSSASDPMRNFGESNASATDVAAFCVDYYEYPNSSSRPPTTSVTWSDAKRACESKSRRLCTEAEWERACKGPGNARFSYGNNYDVDRCNTEDASGQPRALQGASAFKKCRSGFGVYALSGNAEEWTADSFKGGGASSKTAKGGAADRPDWASRCAARRGLAPTTRKDTLGFRCCADPQ